MIRIISRDEAATLGEDELFGRAEEADRADVSATVAAVIADVRARGDEALRDYTRRFDRADIDDFAVTREEIDAAVRAVGGEFLAALRRAGENIRAFHLRQVRQGFVIEHADGTAVGQRVTPIARVGLYIPGGTAAYPSTVLMNAIPASIAGCGEIIMVTPPLPDGSVNPAILAAASVAGVGRIFKCGGSQAVAALAFGTASVPAVDKIVGPGNAYVAEAKRQLSGKVGIDMIAGPSEIMIIADGGSDPDCLAADLLSQAEHDRRATAILITDSASLADDVSRAVERRLKTLPRREIARASIDNGGRIIVTGDIAGAVALANRAAPEHLELCLDDAEAWLDSVRNAGSVFLGRCCPEPVGDYYAGPNHTLPTGGTARFASPLSVDDFVKKTQFIRYNAPALAAAAPDITLLARREGLDAHAQSVEARGEMKL